MPASRIAVLLLAALVCLGLVAPAGAAYAPVEPYAGYEAQSTCSPVAKPGTVALGHWLVANYRGGYGPIARSCAGSSVSECPWCRPRCPR